MQPILIVLVLLLLLLVVSALKAIHVIPQASVAVVERFGRYTRTLRAGLNIVVPFIAARSHSSGSRATAPGGAFVRPVKHDPLLSDDPREVGRHLLTARLGEGGMGTVYLGLSPGRRRVAVKVVRADLAADPGFRKRFAREIDSMRRVGGFHTAQVVDASPEEERPWLVTEYIPGPSPAHRPAEARTTARPDAAYPGAEGGRGAGGDPRLRDRPPRLKPGNIIIAESGARVIDFGIARAVDATALTRADLLVGTRGFLAPEQLTGAPLTPAVDAYAFGWCWPMRAGPRPSRPECGWSRPCGCCPRTCRRS